jgi:UMF1 family MFS transporter
MGFAKVKIRQGFLILSWALYDLANQFFALNVVSLYFVRWLTLERQQPEIFYSISFGISTFFVAVLGPILGAISDVRKRYRPPLIYLTLLSIIFTMVLGISNSILLSLIFFIIANFGCQIAIVFYNALMVNIAPKNKIGLVSGFGKMLGYTGAILALYLIKPVVLKSGYRATFLPTGILFFIFSLPCLIFVKDAKASVRIGFESFLRKDKIIQIFRALKTTAFDAQRFPGLLDFLKAEFFGLSAVNAVILFMSVYATRVFRMSEAQVINLITLSTFFAIAGSISSGFISDYFGHRRSLIIVFILWIICFVSGAFIKNTNLYTAVGALVGMTLGATWVVSRVLAIKLVPQEKIGEVFGLFNLVRYLSAIIGALSWGIILLLLNSFGEWKYRFALLSLTLFMVLGLIFLLRIPQNNKK